jgi:diguanylate cyclase (GGDEF)-like protein/putative nucleotidyltransferase with HDIG domain
MSRWHTAYEIAVERMPDGRVRWRSLGALYFIGGLLALISVLLPHPWATDVLAVTGVAGTAMIVGLFMLSRPPLLENRWVFVFLALGATLISAGVWASHDLDSQYAFFYVWVAFHACFFLERARAVAILMVAGAAYATALGVIDDPEPGEVGRWLITMGTSCVVGLLSGVLRVRSDRLIDRLAEAARTDPLTGLLNRRGFQEFLEERFADQLGLVVADLDHFKALNDRFGHHAGDDVLRGFADLVRKTTPTGGEEFAILIPGADTRTALEVAEALRRMTRESLGAGGLLLTVSLGIATHPEHAETPEDLLRAADKALYLAKQMGRDRSIVFSAEAHAAGELRPSEAARREQAAAVLVMAEALDVRDGGTAAHSRTVGRYAELIARQLGLPEERVERIRLAGVLHDIGNLGVPDQVLRKPGRLTEGELNEIAKHPEVGARILAGAGLDDVASWVVAHHERPDGEGYPYGLSVADIPLEARILAVADAYEAMTASRLYRGARPHTDAAAELLRCSGTQFDDDVVQAFLTALALPEVPERRRHRAAVAGINPGS